MRRRGGSGRVANSPLPCPRRQHAIHAIVILMNLASKQPVVPVSVISDPSATQEASSVENPIAGGTSLSIDGVNKDTVQIKMGKPRKLGGEHSGNNVMSSQPTLGNRTLLRLRACSTQYSVHYSRLSFPLCPAREKN